MAFIQLLSTLRRNKMTDKIKGLSHFFNETTGETSVTWSYEDTPDLEYFVLEVYDENKRAWVPYDNHMGIIRKEISTRQAYERKEK